MGETKVFSGTGSTIDGGKGNDLITNYTPDTSLNGGAGNDTIKNDVLYILNLKTEDGVKFHGDGIDEYFGNNVTMRGGKGNDVIELNSGGGNVIEYDDGDGNDTIYGFDTNTTLHLSSGSISGSSVKDNNVILKVGSGSLTLVDFSRDYLATVASKDELLVTANVAETPASNINTIYNSDDNTLITGTKGKDSIENQGYNVTISAGKGNDTIIGYSRDNSINAGAGNDYIEAGFYYSTIVGGAGNDTIGVWNDYNIYQFGAGDGKDVITYFSGYDTLQITSGSITSQRSNGDDFIITVASDNSTGTVTFKNIGITPIKAVDTLGAVSMINYDINNSKVSTVIAGNKNANKIFNEGENVTINAWGGNDVVYNNANYATIDGGAGNDTIYGWEYNSLYGGAGNDFIWSYYDSTVRGGAGNDIISANGTDIKIQFGSSDGKDTINYFNANDTIQILDGTISSAKASGDNYVIKVKGEKSTGSITLQWFDTLTPIPVQNADGHMSVLNYGIYNFKSNTTVGGNKNANKIFNGAENVKINAWGGNDYVFNNANYATIDGGAGNDSISGYEYNSINGGAGNDYIYGEASTVRGGAGNDTINIWSSSKVIQFGSSDGNDVVDGFYSDDTLQIVDGAVSTHYASGDDYIIGVGDSARITLQNAADNLILVRDKNGLLNYINSSDYPSSVLNDVDKKKITGTTGKDYIYNSGNDVTIQAGKGNDTIDNYGDRTFYQFSNAAGRDLVYNFDFDDTLNITAGSIVSHYQSGDDYVVSVKSGKTSGTITLGGAANIPVHVLDAKGNSTLLASYDIRLNGTSKADDLSNDYAYVTINAGKGNDYITNYGDYASVSGGAGNDFLYNGAYDVTVNGGTGNDTIDGWGGRFIQFGASDGKDIVYNFNTSDTIALTNGTISSHKASGDNYVITVKNEKNTGTVTLNGAANTPVNLVDSAGVSTVLGYSIINRSNETNVGGTSKADKIYNEGANVTISSGKGNDTIYNDNSNVSINAGAGNDYIDGYLYYSTINGGAGNDTVASWSSRKVIQFSATSGKDIVTSFYSDDTLQITSGMISSHKAVDNDYVVTVKSGKNSGVITLGGAAKNAIQVVDSSGNATILGYSIANFDDSTLVSGTKNADRIYNSASSVTINAGNGNDYIYNGANEVTINGGAGNDTIDGYSSGKIIQFSATSGNDIVTSFYSDDTLQITSGTISSHKAVDNDYVVTVKSGKNSGVITLGGAANNPICVADSSGKASILGYSIANFDDAVKVTGTKNADQFYNAGDNVTINGGKGNDTIYNVDLDLGSVNGGAGNDFINGGIYSSTINGGAGNDTIDNWGGNNVIQFSATSGKDLVTGFYSDDTLQITSGTISSSKAKGDNYVITVKDGSNNGTITLGGAASNAINVLDADGNSLVLNDGSSELASEDYWFMETNAIEDDLNSILTPTDMSIDMPTDFNDMFNQSTQELTANVRHRQKK